MELKEFIKQNKNLINTRDFRKIWKKCDKSFDNLVDSAKVNELFLKLGINPLEGLTKIFDNYFFYTDIKHIAIPNSVESIGYRAFEYCSSLTSITIPDSVESIGYAAFSNCSSLTSINYKGTKKQWRDIQKGLNCLDNTIKVIHCVDSNIEL